MSFTSLYWKQEVNGPHRSPEQCYVWLNQLYEVISKIYRQWVKWNFRRWAKNWLFSFNVKIVKHITEYPHNVRSPVSCSGFVTLTGPLMLRRFPVIYKIPNRYFKFCGRQETDPCICKKISHQDMLLSIQISFVLPLSLAQ